MVVIEDNPSDITVCTTALWPSNTEAQNVEQQLQQYHCKTHPGNIDATGAILNHQGHSHHRALCILCTLCIGTHVGLSHSQSDCSKSSRSFLQTPTKQTVETNLQMHHCDCHCTRENIALVSPCNSSPLPQTFNEGGVGCLGES